MAAQSGYCDAYLALGDFRSAMGRLDEAEYAYQQVLKISPRHADGRKRMARLCHHRAVNAISGAEDTALDQVRMALEFTPEDELLKASANELEALASGKRDKKDVLLDWGQRAAKKENWQDAADLLEAYQRLQGKGEGAPPALGNIRQKANEEQLNNLRKQAERMERLEEYDEALLALNKYLALQPEDADQVPQRIQRLKEARKQVQQREGKDEGKPFWKQPLAWIGISVIAALALLLAIPTSPLRMALATTTPAGQVTERVVVATAEPTIVPTPTATPLPYKWTRVTSLQLINRDGIYTVAIHPDDEDIIYAGSRNSGMYKTVDGGISWLPINNGIKGKFIKQILIDPQEPDTVYAGLRLSGLYKTEDGGDSWRRLDVESGGQNYASEWQVVANLAMDPEDSAHLVFVNELGIWESRDKGESWLKLEISFDNPGLAGFDPTTGTLIVAAGEEENPDGEVKIYVSNTQHDEWQLAHEFRPLYGVGLNRSVIAYDSEGNRLLFCGWVDRFQSTDGGLTWVKSGNDDCKPYASDSEGYVSAPGNPERIVKHNFNEPGIQVSDNGGNKWYERSNGLGAVEAAFGFDPESHLIYVSQWVYGGEWWGLSNFYSYGLAKNSFKTVVTSPCGSYPTQPWEEAACSKQVDTDIPWDLVRNFSETNKIWLWNAVKDPQDTGKIYLATQDGVYFSSDGGESWDAISEGFGNMRIVYDLAFDPQNPDDLYALTPYGIYKLEAK